MHINKSWSSHIFLKSDCIYVDSNIWWYILHPFFFLLSDSWSFFLVTPANKNVSSRFNVGNLFIVKDINKKISISAISYVERICFCWRYKKKVYSPSFYSCWLCISTVNKEFIKYININLFILIQCYFQELKKKIMLLIH